MGGPIPAVHADRGSMPAHFRSSRRLSGVDVIDVFLLFFSEPSIRGVESISNLMHGKSEIRRRPVRSTSLLDLALASWSVRPRLVAEVRRC